MKTRIFTLYCCSDCYTVLNNKLLTGYSIGEHELHGVDLCPYIHFTTACVLFVVEKSTMVIFTLNYFVHSQERLHSINSYTV